MTDDNLDVTAPPSEEGGNRAFIIIAAVLGGVFLLALVAIIGVAIWLNAGRTTATLSPAQQTGTIAAAVAATQTATRYVWLTELAKTPTSLPSNTPLPTVKPPTDTPKPSNTPVVNTTPSPEGTTEEATVGGGDGTTTGTPTAGTPTVGATAKAGTKSKTPTKSATALPSTGFGDSSGLPALIALGFTLLVVVIFARQWRLRRTS